MGEKEKLSDTQRLEKRLTDFEERAGNRKEGQSAATLVTVRWRVAVAC
jgi:hypothetical protein